MTQRRKTHYGYTERQAASGTKERLPAIDAFPNQYRGYEVRIEHPEFTCVCPKTGLPDFGCIVIEYVPDGLCLELKSLKYYLLAFRNMGIFNENAVNRILDDVVRACRPQRASVTGSFSARGGLRTVVTARHPRP
ncbi:MAG TPA: NADPH-dependent 7-cyano-7-deazaguanine reductase QueF [Elusimicrobia bacterium]|nr:NADPH-dependent 7-cyano-7-deazaguanine reductase QueF [Elusimicrobiota bacterium]